MIAPLGHIIIVTALLVAVAGSVSSLLGGRLGDVYLIAWGRRSAFGLLGLVAAAAGVMLIALLTHDFSVKYVADVGSRETPIFFTVTSLWAALEGSILLWALLLSGYTCAFLWLSRKRSPALQPYITAILLGISAFFLFVIAWPGDPFQTVSPVPADGPGPNPLLQNSPIMGQHPPLLYLGFVGLSVPYAIALAALLTGNVDTSVFRLMRRWALVPWIFLSLGITAGMWWSYTVLGWGGYWSWDPVENVSLMPWLVTTAFLHSLQVQERRQMLKTWTMSLIIAAFLLSILGTFLTRSGVVSSVHSFTQSAIGPVFLTFFGVVLIGSLALLFARSRELSAPGALDAAVCRETAFLCNNLLFVAITFTILLGTLFPLIAEALQGTQLSVGAPYFNRIAVPIGLALLFLMGVGPALPWGATRLEDLQYRLLIPVSTGVGAILLFLLLGLRGVGTLVTFGLAAFVLAITVGRVREEIGRRRGNTREPWFRASRRLFAANPRRYGGYLAHIGALLVVIGIAASQTYDVRASGTLHPGQSLGVDGYALTYQGLRPHREPNRMVIATAISVTRGGRSLGTFLPSQDYYDTLSQPVVTPAVREEPTSSVLGLLQGRNPIPDLADLLHGRNPFEDLYVVLEDVRANPAHPSQSTATFLVLVNPMIGAIWLGGFSVGLGGCLALLPTRRRRRVRSSVEAKAPELQAPSELLAPRPAEEATA
jgi:cytochrome c-type biogenesis protein CcmF